MKFGQPILTSELSGALGGVVASSSRGGLGYFRVRRRPGNPRTPGQTIIRSILTALSSAWSGSLSPTQRAGWALLSPPTSSGIDSYIAGNAVAQLGGRPRVDDAPASLAVPVTPVVVTPVVDASDDNVTVTIPVDWDTNALCAVFATAPQSASRLARQHNYLFVGLSDTGDTGPQPFAFPDGHPAAAGTAGQIVYIKTLAVGDDAAAIRAGQIGTPQEFRCTVVA